MAVEPKTVIREVHLLETWKEHLLGMRTSFSKALEGEIRPEKRQLHLS